MKSVLYDIIQYVNRSIWSGNKKIRVELFTKVNLILILGRDLSWSSANTKVTHSGIQSEILSHS